jgi:DNA-directed RNA polymerase specialized sigma24 family protein
LGKRGLMRHGNGPSRSDQTDQASQSEPEITAERAVFPADVALEARISSIWRVLRGMGVAVDDVAQATRLSFERAFEQMATEAQPKVAVEGMPIEHVVDPLLAAAYRAAHTHWRPLTNDADEGASSVRNQGELLVLDLLGTLDEPKRVCLLLADMEAWSSPEIAALTGLRLDVVYDELRKARKAFARARRRYDQPGATRDAEGDARELLAVARERFSPAQAALISLRDELFGRIGAPIPGPHDPGSAA